MLLDNSGIQMLFCQGEVSSEWTRFIFVVRILSGTGKSAVRGFKIKIRAAGFWSLLGLDSS